MSLGADRRIQDLSDLPVISPVLNSLLAQEGGKDYGDYVLLTGATLGLRHRIERPYGGRAERQRPGEPLGRRRATPATGSYRPNPALGSGTVAAWRRSSSSGPAAASRCGRTSRDGSAWRAAPDRATTPGSPSRDAGSPRLAGHQLVSRAYLGTATDGLPAYRSFVLGGRGTLLGEPFRAYGGRDVALGQVEWRFEAPIPAIPAGLVRLDRRRLTVAPFVALGAAGRPLPGMPWDATDGVRPVAGVALEWFMRLLRVEAGIGLRTGDFGLTVDINRDWWGLL